MSESGPSLQIVARRKTLYVCNVPDSDQILPRSGMSRRARSGLMRCNKINEIQRIKTAKGARRQSRRSGAAFLPWHLSYIPLKSWETRLSPIFPVPIRTILHVEDRLGRFRGDHEKASRCVHRRRCILWRACARRGHAS